MDVGCGVITVTLTVAFLFVTSIYYVFISPDACGHRISVTTSNGIVSGCQKESRDGRFYMDFRGIPFAAPPIGNLRFQPPKPPASWNGELDARRFRSDCIQWTDKGRPYGSEDCLYLNVFSSNLKMLNSDLQSVPLYPVMVFIYGGYFSFGASSIYGPEYFMDENVVLVTFNYRLGVFGFLNTGDQHVRGNMGLKDQVAALEWVQKNIESFGGDSDRVTIFGESSGAASVHFHMLSRRSRGLFHKAISQSGVALSPWTLTSHPEYQALRFAKNVRCHKRRSKNSMTQMVDCMKWLPAEDLVQGHRELRDPLCPIFAYFTPTVEGVMAEDTFLPYHPETTIVSGHVSKVPWLISVNSEEGLLNTAMIIRNKTYFEIVSRSFDSMAGRLLYMPNDKDLAQQVRQYYFDQFPITRDNIDHFQNVSKMFTDRFWMTGIHRSVRLHSKLGQKVFLTIYDYPGQYSFVNLATACNGDQPLVLQYLWYLLTAWFKALTIQKSQSYVCHTDELPIQFSIPVLKLFYGKSHPDYKMSNALVKLWVNFATSDVDPWPPIEDGSTLQFMLLKNATYSKLINDPYAQRLRFWKKLYVD